MLIGHARVSTGDQKIDLQVYALNKKSCDKIFKDVASTALKNILKMNANK